MLNKVNVNINSGNSTPRSSLWRHYVMSDRVCVCNSSMSFNRGGNYCNIDRAKREIVDIGNSIFNYSSLPWEWCATLCGGRCTLIMRGGWVTDREREKWETECDRGDKQWDSFSGGSLTLTVQLVMGLKGAIHYAITFVKLPAIVTVHILSAEERNEWMNDFLLLERGSTEGKTNRKT